MRLQRARPVPLFVEQQRHPQICLPIEIEFDNSIPLQTIADLQLCAYISYHTVDNQVFHTEGTCPHVAFVSTNPGTCLTGFFHQTMYSYALFAWTRNRQQFEFYISWIVFGKRLLLSKFSTDNSFWMPEGQTGRSVFFPEAFHISASPQERRLIIELCDLQLLNKPWQLITCAVDAKDFARSYPTVYHPAPGYILVDAKCCQICCKLDTATRLWHVIDRFDGESRYELRGIQCMSRSGRSTIQLVGNAIVWRRVGTEQLKSIPLRATPERLNSLRTNSLTEINGLFHLSFCNSPTERVTYVIDATTGDFNMTCTELAEDNYDKLSTTFSMHVFPVINARM